MSNSRHSKPRSTATRMLWYICAGLTVTVILSIPSRFLHLDVGVKHDQEDVFFGDAYRFSQSGGAAASRKSARGDRGFDGKSDWVFPGVIGIEEKQALSNGILDASVGHTMSVKCEKYGGFSLVNNLRDGKENICRGGRTSIDVYGMKHELSSEWFSTLVLHNASFEKLPDDLSVKIGVECMPKEPLEKHNKFKSQEGKDKTLERIFRNGLHHENSSICSNFADGVLWIVDSNDYWNWWWLLVGLQNHFITAAAVMPELANGSHTIGFLDHDVRENSDTFGRMENAPVVLREIYIKMFSSGGMPDARLWETDYFLKGCYGSIVLVRNQNNPSPILKNAAHGFDKCYSPVIRGLATQIQSSVGISSSLPLHNRRICWASRDEAHRPEFSSWQNKRVVKNQTGLIAKLSDYAAEFNKKHIGAANFTTALEVSEMAFYGNRSSLPVAEQLHEAARCSLIIGMHGAGLYSSIVMKHPAVLEFSVRRIANRNAINLMHLVDGFYRGMVIVEKDTNGELNAQTIWSEILKTLEKMELEPNYRGP